MITSLTKYKAELNGAVYHEIGRYVKSSGICHECRHEHKFDLSVREFACESCGTVQCRDLAAAKSVADTGEMDLIATGIVARALPKFQHKSPSKTKVFERSEFGVGSEKKKQPSRQKLDCRSPVIRAKRKSRGSSLALSVMASKATLCIKEA